MNDKLWRYTGDYSLKYLQYQKKYQKNIRESDKKLIEKIQFLKQKDSKCEFRLLDVGCSSGNLLFHIKSLFPDFYLSGFDLDSNAITSCKLDSKLKGIKFTAGSCLEMGHLSSENFNIIILNAVVLHLNDEKFEKTIFEVSKILDRGGSLMMFDFFNPFDQEIEIIERSSYGSLSGVPLFFKSYKYTKSVLLKAGFDKIEFNPFLMPFDLPLKKDNHHDLSTYTISTEKRDRISMRGTVSQPWCHLYATKI
jgi:SAM-dependent methyltransferase